MPVLRRAVLWRLILLASAAGGMAGERGIEVVPAAKSVGRYARIEFALNCKPVFRNPYNPDEVDLRLILTSPSGREIVLPAFYVQPFEERAVERGGKSEEWRYPVGAGAWRARFAPSEVGQYRVVAKLTDRAGSVTSPPVSFDCTPSERRGFVRVSEEDPRFYAFDDGSPFFAVGQDVAFIRSARQARAMFAKLAASGANFVRVWTCCEDWAMAIEARKSAWGRSWAWTPPIAHLPGRRGYHADQRCLLLAGGGASLSPNPCHRVGLKPETRYRLRGAVRTAKGAAVEVQIAGVEPGEAVTGGPKWGKFQREFTTTPDQWWLPRLTFRLAGDGRAWLRDLSLTEADGGPELLWEADVNRPPRGWYNQVDCRILDHVVGAAETHGLSLQLCLLTRDHYMHALGDAGSPAYDAALADAKNLLRYAVARWGYSTSVAVWEYFNEINPGLPLEPFYRECGAYLDRVDPYRHLRASSHWHHSPRHWAMASLDQADEHFYCRPAEGALFKDAAAAVLDRAKRLRDAAPRRPALISEFGVLANNWQPTPELAKDAAFVNHHNALWASALSGLSGTVMHWFWDDIHKRDLYGNYRGVARFAADIPWTLGKLRKAEASVSDGRLRLVGLQGEGGAWLWLQDTAATWWRTGVQGNNPAEVEGAAVQIAGLARGTYRVEWWDTRAGKPIRTAQAKATADGLRLAVPAFARDIACRIVIAK
jgi:hypothetical protein